MSRTSISGLAAFVLLLAGATPAGAAGPPSVETNSFSFAATNPCNGEPGTLAGTETVSTLVADGANHSSYESTARTDETFTPDDPTQPVATGHAAGHTSFVDNHSGGVPFSGTDVFTDVSTTVFHAPGTTLVIHNIAHVTVADGTLVVNFFRPTMKCVGA